jgi:hypothetical protein
MNADLAIDRQHSRSDERGELACGAAPREVHLKETVLRVQEPGGARDILA